MPGGSWLGAILSGYVSDMFGRKSSIQIGAIIWYILAGKLRSARRVLIFGRIIGSIIVCASQNIGMLVAGRVINGISVGICSAQVPGM